MAPNARKYRATGTPGPVRHRLKLVAWKIYLSAILRGWAVWASYRTQAVLAVAGWFIPVFFYFIFSGYLTGVPGQNLISGNTDVTYVAFFVVGLAFQGFSTALFSMLSQRIQTEQMIGTLEQLLISPTPAESVLLYSSVWAVIYNLIAAAAVLLTAAFVLKVDFSVDLLTTCLGIILLILSSLGLAAIAGSVILRTKQGNLSGFTFTIYAQFFGGVLFPVSYLPLILQPISYAMPLAAGLTALRGGLLAGEGVSQVWPSLAYMAGYAAVTLPLGLWLFRRALYSIRVKGTLDAY